MHSKMSGAGFILAINMMAALLAAAFLMVAVYDKKNDARERELSSAV